MSGFYRSSSFGNDTLSHKDISEMAREYPSFSPGESTLRECFFRSTEVHDARRDLSQILYEGVWNITFLMQDKTQKDTIGLTIESANKTTMEVLVHLKNTQTSENLSNLVGCSRLTIAGRLFSVQNPKGDMNIELSEITHFSLYRATGSIINTIQAAYVDRAAATLASSPHKNPTN